MKMISDKHPIFHEKGTEFTKYGRYGNPKSRLVWLNPQETEILWRDKEYPAEAPRSMLISDVIDVQIGSDHT